MTSNYQRVQHSGLSLDLCDGTITLLRGFFVQGCVDGASRDQFAAAAKNLQALVPEAPLMPGFYVTNELLAGVLGDGVYSPLPYRYYL